METPSRLESAKAAIQESRDEKAALVKARTSLVFTCDSAKTCTASSEKKMSEGQGACARCSRLKKPDLYVYG
jgi:hypothetical protein